MINTDYNIAAMEVLLEKNSISEKYYPLIPHKAGIISGLRELGCKTKSSASSLADDALERLGLNRDQQAESLL